MTMREMLQHSATKVVDLLRRGEVSPAELVDVVAERVAKVHPAVNAMPITCFDRARDAAKHVSAEAARNPASWLAGLPVGIKDLQHVEGVRTTMGGSPAFKDHISTFSSRDVEKIEANGGLVVGKLTAPEFGFNATTSSRLFGHTRNPWNTRLSTAGSSGGSAAAVAAGMVWAASGSDMGASIRTPASFCGVVGHRPSPGLVAKGPGSHVFSYLPVLGPMAREVSDTALMLNAMVGRDRRDPISYTPDEDYTEAVRTPRLPRRIGLSVDLGITHCDREIAALTRAAGAALAAEGCIVEEAHPDLGGAMDVVHVIRGTWHVIAMAPLIEAHPDLATDEIAWTVEKARQLTIEDVARAERQRERIIRNMNDFFDRYDYLLCPANAVPAFPVEWTTVTEHEGHVFGDYIDWIAITFAITLTACPVISVPCGLLGSGMPLGLQLIGPPRSDYELYRFAAAFEQIAGPGRLTPIDPVVRHTDGDARQKGED